MDVDEEVARFNEAREIVIKKYLEVKKTVEGELQGDEEEKKIDFSDVDAMEYVKYLGSLPLTEDKMKLLGKIISGEFPQ